MKERGESETSLLLVVVGDGVGGIGIGIGSEAARRDFFDERLGLIALCKEKKVILPLSLNTGIGYIVWVVARLSLIGDKSEQGQSVIGGRGCRVLDLCGLLLRLT